MTVIEMTVSELAQAGRVELGASPWREVSQEQVDLFADATDDHQWIHVDAERSAEGPFGGTIAHGHLTLSLLPVMLKDLLVVADQGRGTNYGFDSVRFLAPVPVGARVRLAAEVVDTAARDDGAVRYAVASTVEIEGADKPAVVARCLYLAYPG